MRGVPRASLVLALVVACAGWALSKGKIGKVATDLFAAAWVPLKAGRDLTMKQVWTVGQNINIQQYVLSIYLCLNAPRKEF